MAKALMLMLMLIILLMLVLMLMVSRAGQVPSLLLWPWFPSVYLQGVPQTRRAQFETQFAYLTTRPPRHCLSGDTKRC